MLEKIKEIADFLNPFGKVSVEEMSKKDFMDKWKSATHIIMGTHRNPAVDKKNKRIGILDFVFLGPIIGYKIEESYEFKLESKLHLLWTFPCEILFGAQLMLGYFLALIAFPFVALTHWLYPRCLTPIFILRPPTDQERQKWRETFSSEMKHNISELKGYNKDNELATKGQNRRRYFFNPTLWITLFAVAVGISLLIQSFDLSIFAQAAAPLFVIQMATTAIALLMLAGAIYSLISHLLISEADLAKKSPTNASLISPPGSAAINYIKDFFTWCKNNPQYAIPTVGFGVACVLTALILTIGYFTDGFGIFPGSFVFMSSFFNFIANGFVASLHHSSALPGLEFLANFSDATIQLTGQILAATAFVVAAIFIPDNLRILVQNQTTEIEPIGNENIETKNPQDDQKQPEPPQSTQVDQTPPDPSQFTPILLLEYPREKLPTPLTDPTIEKQATNIAYKTDVNKERAGIACVLRNPDSFK